MSQMIVKIGGDAAGFKKSLNETQAAAKNAGKGISSALSTGMKVAGGLGVAFGIKEIVNFGKAVTDVGDDIDKGSRRLTVTAEQYQQLGLMARFSGAEASNVEMAFKTVSDVITDAGLGASEAEKKLGLIGLRYRELKDLSPYQQFEEVATAIAAIQNPTERLTAATTMFGKSGKQLMPLIKDFDAVKRQVEETATLMSNKAVADAAKFKDQMEALNVTFKSIAADTGFIDYLNKIAKAFADISVSIPKNEEKFGFRKTGFFENVATGFWEAALPEGKLKDRFRGGVRATGAWAPGASIGLTPSEQASLESQKEKGHSSMVDKKNKEAEQKATREQTQYEEQNKKAIEEQARALERAFEEKRKGQEIAREMVSDMQHEVEMQKLITSGKEREAAVQDAIYRAKKRSSELTEDDLATLADQAGQLYDMNEESKKKDPKQEREGPRATSLERIGAILGGGRSSDPSYRVQNEHLKVAKETKEIQKKILEKQTDASLGAV